MLSLCAWNHLLHFQGVNVFGNKVTFTKSKLGSGPLDKMWENRVKEVLETFGADKTIERSYGKSSDRKSV